MIQVNDKHFELFISKDRIQKKIFELSEIFNNKFLNKELVFIPILNGSFMFASDIMKNMKIPCEISFVKVKSYQGTSSTERVDELIGLYSNIENKAVIIIEDIVDTGITMNKVFSYLKSFNPSSIEICSLLYKPDAFKGKHSPDYVGFEIPNKFVVGYGLDYNEKGRNFEDIYQLKD